MGMGALSVVSLWKQKFPAHKQMSIAVCKLGLNFANKCEQCVRLTSPTCSTAAPHVALLCFLSASSLLFEALTSSEGEKMEAHVQPGVDSTHS